MLTGHERSVKAKKNIIASFLIKGISIIIGFLLVRLTLDYLDQTRYGIWLTLSSFLTWFTFFDIGLGNGLRNKLAEALALKDYNLAKIYVSTTYAILSLVISIVAIAFVVANFFINWTVILNTDKALAPQLSQLALIVFGFFFLNFVIKLIGVVLYADQRPALANSFGSIANMIILIVIYVLTKTTDSSLIYLGWTLSIVPVFVLMLASIYLYSTDYKSIAPSFKYINFKYSRDLLDIGVKFLVIQIVGLIVYQTSNIIITQFFGPAEVTPYNIAYRYFSTINMVFTVILMPFWSAYTDAWVNSDISWIKNIIKKTSKIWIGTTLLGMFMLFFSNDFFRLWVGTKIHIPFQLSLLLFIYFASLNFESIYNVFLNGVSKIKIQLILSVVSAVTFIPLVLIFIKIFNLGIFSIPLAMVLSNLYGIILSPVQYNLIIHGKGRRIWYQ